MKVLSLVKSIEGFVVAEKSDNGISFQFCQPLVRRGMMPNSQVSLASGMKLLRTWKRPLCFTRRMRSESRCVSRFAEISNDKRLVGELAVQVRFEMRKVEHALAQPVSNDDDAFTLFDIERQ